MQKKLLSALLVFLIVFGPVTNAFAEALFADADLIVNGNQTTIFLGNLSPEESISREVLIFVNGNVNSVIKITPTSTDLEATSVELNSTAKSQLSSVTGKAPKTTGDFSYTVTWATNDIKSNNTAAVIFKGTVVPSDTTPPSTTISHTSNEWTNEDVTVTLTAADNEDGSGVKETWYQIGDAGWMMYTTPFTLSEGIYEIKYYSTDNAGNKEFEKTQTVKIDKTVPVITGSTDSSPNEKGWYNKDVTVNFAASDNLSGVAEVTAPVTLTEEGANQSATGSATDVAGNSASTILTGINIDKTAPEVTMKEVYKLHESATWSASDGLSGLATAESGSIDTSTVGTKEMIAIDNAGNKTVITYTVLYDFGGIMQPINSNGSSVFKAGSSVPVKFQLTEANGNFVTNAVATITIAKSSNNVWGTESEAVSTSAASTGNTFRYDLISNQYIFNLNTKGFTVGTYQLTIKLDDGTAHKVQIGLK